MRWKNKNTYQWPVVLVISVPKIVANGQFLFNVLSKTWSHVFFLKHNVVVFVVDKICDNTIVSEWNSLLICFVNCTDIYNFTNHVLTELKPEM